MVSRAANKHLRGLPHQDVRGDVAVAACHVHKRIRSSYLVFSQQGPCCSDAAGLMEYGPG